MGLYFKNATVSPVWVIYGYERPGCEGGVDWAKKGWYQINPASTAKVWSGWVGGNCWMYYAEDDFGHSWAGAYNAFVPWTNFDWCWNTSSTSGKTVGMRIFCVDWDTMDDTKILTL